MPPPLPFRTPRRSRATSSTPSLPPSSTPINLRLVDKLQELALTDPEFLERFEAIMDQKIAVLRLHRRWAADGAE